MRSQPEFQPRLRFINAGRNAFGPGKAELLAFIAQEGSIRTAAKKMDMSYQRAWTLVREMNTSFREPLVTAARGGQMRGGATLTAVGEEVLERYHHMLEVCRTATKADWKAVVRLLRP